MDPKQIKLAVRDHYARAARGERSCCSDPAALGYGPEALAAVPRKCARPRSAAAARWTAADLRPASGCSTWAAAPGSTSCSRPGRWARKVASTAST